MPVPCGRNRPNPTAPPAVRRRASGSIAFPIHVGEPLTCGARIELKIIFLADADRTMNRMRDRRDPRGSCSQPVGPVAVAASAGGKEPAPPICAAMRAATYPPPSRQAAVAAPAAAIGTELDTLRSRSLPSSWSAGQRPADRRGAAPPRRGAIRFGDYQPFGVAVSLSQRTGTASSPTPPSLRPPRRQIEIALPFDEQMSRQRRADHPSGGARHACAAITIGPSGAALPACASDARAIIVSPTGQGSPSAAEDGIQRDDIGKDSPAPPASSGTSTSRKLRSPAPRPLLSSASPRSAARTAAGVKRGNHPFRVEEIGHLWLHLAEFMPPRR